MRVHTATLLVAFLLAASLLCADTPVREEQFVYSILAYNGRDYSSTFARKDAESIYLIADKDSILTVRNVFVYYWPITRDWNIDATVLNVPFEGKLEVTKRGEEPWTLNMTPYTYFNVRGTYELNWQVAQGDEANRIWNRYVQAMDAFRDDMFAYQRLHSEYTQRLNALSREITELRSRGEDVTELMNTLERMKPPPEPEYPSEYQVPPTAVQQGFVINLPAGEYNIRFITHDGYIMEGSERQLVIFDRRRYDAIGLDVIPGDKWTRPVESRTPSSVLYVSGSADIFLRPFFQEEYNDLFYEKLRKNDAQGNPSVMKWVRTQQVPGASIVYTSSALGTETVTEQPYYVQQAPGASPGYQIVPFDPEGAHRDRDASLQAFRLPIQRDSRVITLHVLDRDGKVLPTSERQIRIVSPSSRIHLSLVLACVPLLVMGLVIFRRSRIYMK